MPYVIPAKRGGPTVVPNSGKPVTRLKAIVVPRIGNKLVVVRHSSGDLTFPGGGCRYGSNPRECAIKELLEETRKTINKKVKNLNNNSYMFTSKLRSPNELASDKKNGINVTSEYHVFLVPVFENFENIKKNTTLRNF